MPPQLIISIATFFAGLVLPFLHKGNKIGCWSYTAILSAGLIAAHFAYPNRYQDAMWLIGAFIAFIMNIISLGVGTVVGLLVRKIIRKLK